jgi:hypothetical protein
LKGSRMGWHRWLRATDCKLRTAHRVVHRRGDPLAVVLSRKLKGNTVY